MLLIPFLKVAGGTRTDARHVKMLEVLPSSSSIARGNKVRTEGMIRLRGTNRTTAISNPDGWLRFDHLMHIETKITSWDEIAHAHSYIQFLDSLLRTCLKRKCLVRRTRPYACSTLHRSLVRVVCHTQLGSILSAYDNDNKRHHGLLWIVVPWRHPPKCRRPGPRIDVNNQRVENLES